MQGYKIEILSIYLPLICSTCNIGCPIINQSSFYPINQIVVI
jgi:hypothetical protein